MIFRRFTCLLLSTLLGFQSIAPTLAMQKLEDLEQPDLRKYSSVPANLSFKAQPGRTAAGTFLYTLHEGRVLFLLGERKESKQWCNPGGGSEEGDGKEVFLFHTAARETDEELNRFYCPHARLLKNQPFIDTYNGSLFYRMYWQQAQYLDEKIFIEKRQSTSAEGQEFTDFRWVEASHLWQAVENQQPVIQISPEKKIEIYPELFTTLSTLSGKAFLESLIKHQKIKRFDKNLRPFINQLYFVGTEAPTLSDLKPMLPLSWPTLNVDSKAEAAMAQKQEMENMSLSPLPICPITEESKSDYLNKRAAFLETKDSLAEVVFPANVHQVVALDKEGDKSIFAGAVAAHLGSMIELKRLFLKKEAAVQNIAAKEKGKLEDSYSDMSLRIILGPDYKTPDHFPEVQNPQDAADEENIRIYLDRYYGTLELGDGKREVKVLPSDHTLIKSILQWERRKACPTIYSATSDIIYSLTLFFTHLRKYMMATPLEGLPGFRGTDIYFKGIKTMGDAIQKYGYRDYTPGEANGRNNLVLCGNVTALAGLSTTRTSSSSIEYVMNNHSVRPPDLGSVIQEALALSGFDDPTNKYFHALFQQFIAYNHPEYANSVMFAIQLHPDLLQTYTYPAFGGGSPFTQKDEYTIQFLSENPSLDLLNGMGPRDIALYAKEAGLFCKVLDQEEMEIPQDGTGIALNVFNRLKKSVETNTPPHLQDKKALLEFTLSRSYTKPEEKYLTTPQIFGGLEGEYNKQKQSPEPFEQDKERKKALISEIRILPHPRIAFDSEKFLVTPFPRFPIPNEQVCQYQMDLISMAMIADWLENENCILEGAFHQYSVAKNLYNRAHLGVTGKPVKEKLSSEGFFHLVQHGHVEAVKGYIETYPHILENVSKNQLILAALKSNVPDMLKLILIDLKDTLQIKVSDEEMTKLLRIARDSKWSRSAAFILDHILESQLDLSDAFLPVLYQLLQPELTLGLFPEDNDLQKRLQLLRLCNAPSDGQDWFKDLIVEHLFTTTLFQVINEVCLQLLFPHKVISPLDLVMRSHEELCSAATWGSMVNFGLPYQRLFMNFLKQIDQAGGPDLLFQKGLSGDPFIFDLVKWGNPLCKDLLTYLKTKPALFTVKNNEGLGLLAAFQKAHLEGYPAKPLTSFITLYKQEGFNLERESYLPFFQLYGLNYKEDALADHTSLLNQSRNREWALQLASAMPPQNLSKLLETCPDGRLWKKFSYKIDSLQLSKIIERRRHLHASSYWINKLKKALKAQQNKQEGKLEQERYNPFDLFGSMSNIPGFMKSSWGFAKATHDTMDDQFPDMNSFKDKDTEELQSLSDLLSHIPESISSVGDILEKLTDDYWYEGLDVYFQSLPEFSKASELLENRKKDLAVKRTQWLNHLKELVEAKNEPEIYRHVGNMPFLDDEEYSEADTLLYHYISVNLSSRFADYRKEDQEEKWVKKVEMIPALIQQGHISSEQIKNLILASPSAAALRKSLHIFLKKNMADYLPAVLSGAYGCAADFAKENLFHQKLDDNIYSFPGTYHHPFPYALMGGEDPVLMVQNLQPYLDHQYAPDLLRRLDRDHFWKFIKANKPKDIETLVKLVPWMFQWHEKKKDFFLLSIQQLPKPALNHLIMASLDLLKITEMSRCLPYFVHLMMDGGNEAIINQALIQDPSLLEIQSLDGLGMNDFLTFYASPTIVKAIHSFQKKGKGVEKIHSTINLL